MPTAYVLLNTEIGAENQVLNALKGIEGVKEAHSLWGVYDIIAHVNADSMDKLKFIISHKISDVGKINSKLTMIITEQKPHPTPEHMVFEPETMMQTA
ncbi:MAG: Lrp/AsnC family transcriptional regulator [Candidatus Bathyarchaeota archaeon]|nr:Lrp/AsnC family transcriptional regulator [Candidatus Bathyarchaeota archaeon]